MLSTRFLTAISAAALLSLGCGDSGTGGSGGTPSNGGSPSDGGSPSNGGDAPVGGSTDGGAPPAGGEGPVGGEAAGGAPGTGGAGGSSAGNAALFDACTGNDDCESGICHNFPQQGGMLCTQLCESANDCPPPSTGCNGMGYCKPPGA